MLIILLLLLAGGTAVVAAQLYWRALPPHFTRAAGCITTGVSLLLWLLWRPPLPLRFTASAWPSLAHLPPWNWHADEITWTLTGLLLLLATAMLLVTPEPPADRPTPTPPAAALILWLAAGALPTIWADTIPGLMTGWMLFALSWGIILLRLPQVEREVTPLLLKAGLWLAPLCFYALAAAVAPAVATSALNSGQWPLAARTAISLAALWQTGSWLLLGWQPALDDARPPTLWLFARVLPTITGLAVLSRLASSGQDHLLLTSLGLLGFLLGLWLAWLHSRRLEQLVAALILSQASLAILSGAWVSPVALLAETRVLLCAPAILLLAGTRPPADNRPLPWPRWLHFLVPGIALLALAGLPPTAGFVGRAALIQAWLANGRLLLVIITALLHIPLITAILWFIFRQNQPPTAAPSIMPAGIPRVGATLLLLLGLIPTSGGALLATLSPITWAALLLPPLSAGLLFRHLPEIQAVRSLLRQALALNLPLPQATRLWAGLHAMGAALRHAATLLEGEGGLLWLLALILIFLLAG